MASQSGKHPLVIDLRSALDHLRRFPRYLIGTRKTETNIRGQPARFPDAAEYSLEGSSFYLCESFGAPMTCGCSAVW